MAKRDDIPKTDPSEIEALIQRLKHVPSVNRILLAKCVKNARDHIKRDAALEDGGRPSGLESNAVQLRMNGVSLAANAARDTPSL